MKDKLIQASLELFYKENKRLKKEIKYLQKEVGSLIEYDEDLKEALTTSGELIGITVDGVDIYKGEDIDLYFWDNVLNKPFGKFNAMNPELTADDFELGTKIHSGLYLDFNQCVEDYNAWKDEEITEFEVLGVTADEVVVRKNYGGKLYYFTKSEEGFYDNVNIEACVDPDIFSEDEDYSGLYADITNCKQAHAKWVEENL